MIVTCMAGFVAGAILSSRRLVEKGFSQMARKPQTAANLKKKAAELLQRYVRMKAADLNGICECVSCGKRDSWKAMDGGHFISRTYTFHMLREENVHPQCKRCNRFFTGCHDDYRRYMVDMYGEDFVEWLTDTKRTITKYTRADLLAIIAELKQGIKDQEMRLAFAD